MPGVSLGKKFNQRDKKRFQCKCDEDGDVENM